MFLRSLIALSLLFSLSFANAESVYKRMKAQISNQYGLEMGFCMEDTDDCEPVVWAQIHQNTWKGEVMSTFSAHWKAGTVRVEKNNGAVYHYSADAWSSVKPKAKNVKSEKQAGGQFATGYEGQLEKFDVGSGPERYRLVFRNDEGFVTWVDVEDFINKQWGSYRVSGESKEYDRYLVSWKKGIAGIGGGIINAVNIETMLKDEDAKEKAYEKNPNGGPCPVLAVRDTEDGINNGKWLTKIYPSPFQRAGEQYCGYKVTMSYGTHRGTKQVTHGKAADLQKYAQ